MSILNDPFEDNNPPLRQQKDFAPIRITDPEHIKILNEYRDAARRTKSILNDVVALARTCRTCRHWKKENDWDDYGTCGAIHFSDEYPKGKEASLFHYGASHEKKEELMMRMQLDCGPGFGCALHERKEPYEDDLDEPTPEMSDDQRAKFIEIWTKKIPTSGTAPPDKPSSLSDTLAE